MLETKQGKLFRNRHSVLVSFVAENSGNDEGPMPVAVMAKSIAIFTDGLIGRTLASDVLHRLRADIVGSQFLLGERLRFDLLHNRYSASFGTLREALAHLVHEGLVAAEGQRGFRVAPVSSADLMDLVETRILVKREALRLSLLHGDDRWRAGVTATFEALDAARRAAEAAGTSPSPDWHCCHEGFHTALVTACGSATLLGIRALLAQRADRYRTLAWRLRPLGSGPVDDHRGLHTAALAQDGRRTRLLVEGQIRRFGDQMLRHAVDLLVAD
jgi:DNA-binding GntR family transcriptional regulator